MIDSQLPVHHSDELWNTLAKEVQRREDSTVVEQIQLMCDLYENQLPDEYDKYFPSGAIKHTVGIIRLAWDDLATSVGRRPDLRMDALDETNREERRVGLLERVANGYLDRAEPHGDVFMWLLGWWLVGTGRAIAIVRPGVDKQGQPSPIMSIRDPRHALPTMTTVNNIPTELHDIAFKYEVDERVAIELGLAEDRGAFPSTDVYVNTGGDHRKVQIIEFIDDTAWTLVSEQGYYQREEHNLGMTPAWVFQTFAPNFEAGLSLFKHQVSMQVAVSQLLSLKLAAADRNVNPIYWVKGHQGTLKLGANVINKLSATGEIGRIDPPMIPQVDRDIDQLLQLSRLLNRNPEVRQGEVQSKGQYTSAKTLEQLSEAIDTVVGRHWDIISVGMQHLMKVCYRMDETLWPKEEKHITTNVKNKTRRDTYVPGKDIDGRYYINVDHGFGLDGYQGFLQNVQANAAGFKSRKQVMETMPGVSDVDKEMREIELEQMDAAGMQALMAQAASGQLDVLQWAEMRELMAKKGMSLHEVAVKMQERLQEQAAAAQQEGAGALPLTTPPGPAEAPVEEAPLPGVPPAALV